ncbi:hypothetical protein [Mesorhizobium sp. Cs1321R2N1]|uniref:hypothetical protein n=1 Tax=Mesorhizobium sp. Cs1321R2N1 TaxID=3015174 RepID=UPI00301B8C40
MKIRSIKATPPTPAAAVIINDVLSHRLAGRDAIDIAGAELVCLPFWTGVQSINDRTRLGRIFLRPSRSRLHSRSAWVSYFLRPGRC